MTATAMALTERRELAQRISNGIEVTLFWNQRTNEITVEVVDFHSGEALQVPVDGDAALEAFHHPYAYAANNGAPA
jgi:hypothetical protein